MASLITATINETNGHHNHYLNANNNLLLIGKNQLSEHSAKMASKHHHLQPPHHHQQHHHHQQQHQNNNNNNVNNVNNHHDVHVNYARAIRFDETIKSNSNGEFDSAAYHLDLKMTSLKSTDGGDMLAGSIPAASFNSAKSTPIATSSAPATVKQNSISSNGAGGRLSVIRNWLRQNRWRKKDKEKEASSKSFNQSANDSILLKSDPKSPNLTSSPCNYTYDTINSNGKFFFLILFLFHFRCCYTTKKLLINM